MDININHEKCVLYDCLECLDVCPVDIFTVKNGKLVLTDKDKCYRCLVCQDICNYDAITFDY